MVDYQSSIFCKFPLFRRMIENDKLYSNTPSKTVQSDCCDECGQVFPIKSEDELSADRQNEDNDSQEEDGKSPEKKHECDLCSKKFITFVAVLFHKRAHHDGPTVMNSDSSDREIPTTFQDTDNDIQNLMNDNSCNREYPNATALETFTRLQDTQSDNEYPRKCNVCDRELKDAIDLEIHKVYHNTQNTESSLSCKTCNKSFTNATDLNTRNHDKSPVSTNLTSKRPRISKAPIKCSCCDPEPIKRTRLKRQRQPRNQRGCNLRDNNLANLTDEEIYNKCLFGDSTNKHTETSQKEKQKTRSGNAKTQTHSTSQTFQVEADNRLTQSMETNNSRTDAEISLSTCSTLWTGDLSRHTQSGTTETASAESSLSTFSIRQNVDLHRQTQSETTENAESRLCTAQTLQVASGDRLTESGLTASLGHYNSRYKTHSSSEEIYAKDRAQCGICHKIFSKYYLKIHAGTHTKERPFPCEICGKSFLQMQHLVEHNRLHTGEKPHECNSCGKRFSMKGNLNKHKFLHTGLKLYSCDICNRSFTTLYTLERHLKRTHKGNVTKICKICNQTLKRSCRSEKHQRQHTGKDVKSNWNSASNIRVVAVETESRMANNERAETESGLSYTLPNFHAVGTPSQTDSVQINNTDNSITPQATDLHHPTECRTTKSTREEPSNCDNRVKTSVLDVQCLTEKQPTDNRVTATLPNCNQRLEAMATSNSANSSTQLHSDPQLVDLTSCNNNDELFRELEATEPTGITYICFKCDTEFELPCQLVEHIDKVHPDEESSM